MSFERDVLIDKPGIVGARWWHKSLIAEDAKMRRRQVLKTLVTVGGVAGAIGLVGYAITKIAAGSSSSDSGESVKLETRKSLEMQRQYGWDFGARGEALVFDGKTTAPFARFDLPYLADVMRSASYSPFSITTLLESVTAVPKSTLPQPPDGSATADSAAPFQKLADVLVPVETPAMRRAYRVGLAIARLARDKATKLALLVDLEGPDSVAFAAGASELFEPVLLFDNWPHPRGVVPTHMTLAALAYYQPRFALQNKSRSAGPPPMFLLDRLRTSPYSEDSTRFDNRYYAKPPHFASLAPRGFNDLLYVVETASSLPEPNDLDELAVTAPVVARAIAITDFSSPSSDTDPAYYGGSQETDASIWTNYPFVDGYSLPAGSKIADSTTKDYRFKPHATTGTSLPVIGATAVVVTASGLLVAAALDRRGSMNRFSGGWGG